MPNGQFTPLSDLERDALAELSNIAMARAANSLRQMVEHEVKLSVPSVEILSQEAATRSSANPTIPIWSRCARTSAAPFPAARC